MLNLYRPLSIDSIGAAVPHLSRQSPQRLGKKCKHYVTPRTTAVKRLFIEEIDIGRATKLYLPADLSVHLNSFMN